MKQVTKAIQVDSNIHNKLKQYCDDNGLRLQRLVEKLILKELENGK